MEEITISMKEYNSLKADSEAYHKIKKRNQDAAKSGMARLTPEQRRERAKKAVAARIAKYGQKSRKTEQS